MSVHMRGKIRQTSHHRLMSVFYMLRSSRISSDFTPFTNAPRVTSDKHRLGFNLKTQNEAESIIRSSRVTES